MAGWFMFPLMFVQAMVGLMLAARAHDGFAELVGLLLFLFAVLFSFGLVRTMVGNSEAEPS